MQLSTILSISTFLLAALAAPASEAHDNVLLPRQCGAAGSCTPVPSNELCNDRCQRCSGPTGPYARGACGGFLFQTCRCFYD